MKLFILPATILSAFASSAPAAETTLCFASSDGRGTVRIEGEAATVELALNLVGLTVGGTIVGKLVSVSGTEVVFSGPLDETSSLNCDGQGSVRITRTMPRMATFEITPDDAFQCPAWAFVAPAVPCEEISNGDARGAG